MIGNQEIPYTMAPKHKNHLFIVAAASAAALAILSSGRSQDLSANTRSFGSDRLVARTPLTDSDGEAGEVPSTMTAFQRRGGGGGRGPAADLGGTKITNQPNRVIRDRFPAFS